ncbi:MAG: DUF3768 domain-containing protein [Elusimicrobiota bacterium]
MNIAERNDLLRASIPCISKPNALLLTRGIYDKFNDDDVAKIMAKVKTFNNFTTDNDPWKEHDFGSFEHNGVKIFWKIDDYAGAEGLQLVLTILLAEEY